MVTLNEKIVKSAKVKDKIYYIWDDKIIGFGLKVIPNGKKKYVFRYLTYYGGRNAKQRWFLFGNSNIHSCTEARRIAIDLAKDVMAGKDPQEEKEEARKSKTMADFWKIFDERYICLKEKSKNYRRRNLSIWKNIIAPDLAHKQIKNITANDIAKLHAKYFDKKYFANRALSLLHLMFNLMETWGYRPKHSNPCDGIKRYKEIARVRYLSKCELKGFFKEVARIEKNKPDSLYALSAIKLLFLTGARKNEILTCKWEYVDFEKHFICLPDSKTGAKIIYLNTKALKLLKKLHNRPECNCSPYIIKNRFFSSHLVHIKYLWKIILKNAGITDFRIHDIRHTVASFLISEGYSLSEVACILGHKSIMMSQKYAHLSPEKALNTCEAVSKIVKVVS
ncbi:MAG: site-specific integrase [Acetobacter sp.]|nr:site-specific integrase [Acetobacter sp.]